MDPIFSATKPPLPICFFSTFQTENESKSTMHPSRRPLKLFKLHGSMQQKDRLKIVEDVKKSEYCVLFCTDVAARGLDLPMVDWIVQYNPPTTTADYVHR